MRLDDEGRIRDALSERSKIYIQNGWQARAASRAMNCGDARLIEGRASNQIYLARFWLHSAKRLPDGQFDSGNSVLLHWIARDDDDGALHDHPWSFRSNIVSGGYVEELPGGRRIERKCGDVFNRKATDLHRVVDVQPDTWTLVLTGPKERSWGFLPDGGTWTDWRTYLGLAPNAAGDE